VLSLFYATRVLLIVSIAPLILTFKMGADITGSIGPAATDLSIRKIALIALMALAALVGWKGGERIGFFGVSILRPMITTGILSLKGLIHLRP